jgi:Sec-independent protein translocase protein TatA
MTPTLAFLELTPGSILLLLILGALLFGKQLPTVGGWLGKTVKSVHDGIRGVEHDVNTASPRPGPPPQAALRPPQRISTAAPRFDDKPAAPTAPPSA